jgi:nucleoside-diphosphate-sugar epimerase
MAAVNLNTLQAASVLVVGASGFLGRPLTRALAELGAHVVAASRSIDPSGEAAGVTWRRCDASDPEQVAAVFREVQPEIVYHLTSDSRGGREFALIPDSIRNDVIATTNVLAEATRCKVRRIVMTGSFEEPKGSAGDAVPSSPYAAAKWTSCAYARMFAALYGLPVTVLRLMMTYGPGQKDYKVIPYTIKALLAGETARLASGERLLDWVYVDDVTDAFLRAGAAGTTDGRSIDIGTGQAVRLRDVLSLVAELVERPHLLAFGDVPDRAMERQEVADPRAAMEQLGWSATISLREGLFRTVETYRAQGLALE